MHILCIALNSKRHIIHSLISSTLFLCRLPNIVNTVFLFCLLHECYLFGSSLSRCSHNLCHIHLEMCHFDTEYVWWQFGFSLRYGNIAVYFHPAPPPLLFSPSFGSIGSFSSAPSFSVNVCKSCNCLAFELLHNIFRSFFLPYWSLLVTISWEC